MTEENISFEEQDIRTKISIIEISIEHLENVVADDHSISNEHRKLLEKRITQEYKSLEKMKNKYPEYFI